ncbi:MAG: HEAT repeat domain-containing protein [Armatimonadota bacterium]
MGKVQASRFLLLLIAGVLALAAFAQPEILPPVAAGAEDPDPVPVLTKQLQSPDAAERLAAIDRITGPFFHGRFSDELIPPLCALVNDPDARVRARAAAALGELHPIMRKALAAALLAALHDPEPAVRAAAARSLGRCWQGRLRLMEEYPGFEREDDEANAFYPTKEALAALTAAQDDPDTGVRKAAAFALAMIGDRKALAALQPWLQDPEVNVRLEVLDVLRHAGREEAVPVITAALQDASPAVRKAALHLLVDYRTPEATDALLGAFSAPEAEMRRTAAQAFVFRKEPRAVESLLALLQDADPGVCMTAGQALANTGDPRAVAPLLAMLQHADAARRQAAAQALAQVDNPRVPDALAAILDDPDPGVRQAVVAALAQHNDPRALHPLEDALKSKDVRTRRDAAAALEGSITNSGAVDLLIVALRDPDKYVRIFALQSLQKCREERAVPAVAALLDSPDFETRRSVVQTLSEMRLPAVLPPRLRALHDRNRELRQTAADTLERLYIELPVGPLLQAMKDPDPAVRRAVAPLLVRCTDAKKYDGLALALKDPDEEVRLFALQAMQNRGEGFDGLGPLISAVIALAKHPNPAMRAAALRVLSYSRFAALAPGMITAALAGLDDADAKVRQAAISALDGLNDPALIPSLIRAAGDKDLNVRRQAVQVLGGMEDRRAAEALAGLWPAADPDTRVSIAWALTRLKGRRTLDVLLDGCREKNPRVRAACVAALASWYGAKVDRALAAALQDADDAVRQSARDALAARTDLGVLPALLEAAKGENLPAKIKALQLLANYQDGRIEAVVRPLLQDPSSRVRSAAVQALGQNDAPWALDLLLIAARDADPRVRIDTARWLAASRDDRAQAAVRRLLRDPSKDVRNSTLNALSQEDAGWAVDACVPLLSDPECSDNAQQVLRQLSIAEITEPLLAMLYDPQVKEKLPVLGMLIEYADARAVPALLDILRGGDENLREAAGTALLVAARDPRAVPAVTAAADDANPVVRTAARRALSRFGTETADDLARQLSDPAPGVRLGAARQLALRKDSRALEPLLALLNDENGRTRYEAAAALGALGGPRAEAALIALLQSPDEPMQLMGLYGLQALRSPAAVTAVLALLKDAARRVDLRTLGGVNDPRMLEERSSYHGSRAAAVRSMAFQVIRALTVIGPPAVEPATALLNDALPQTRAAAAIALKDLRDTRALPALCAALKDNNLTVRLLAARALRELADVRGLEPLLAALPGADPLLRVQIAAALGGIGDPRALPVLLTLLQTGTPDEQYAAARALGQLGEKRAADPLLAVLKTHPDDGVRAQAARVLGLLGDQRAVEPLLAALEANDPELTAEAVDALAALNDPRVLPVLRALREQGGGSTYHHQLLGVADALSRMQGPQPLPDDPLAGYRGANRFEKHLALLRIGANGDTRAVEPLLNMLSPAAPDLSEIIQVLGELRDPRAVDPLLELLRQKAGNAVQAQSEAHLLERIAVALGNIGDPRAAAPLAQAYALLPDENVSPLLRPEFRAGFLPAFGKLQAPEVYNQVLAALNDPRREIRAAAAFALGQYRDLRAVEPLIAALQDTAAPWPARTVYRGGVPQVVFAPTVREEAARALGAIGDKRAIPPLIAALDRGTLPDRRAAADSLQALTGQQFGLDAAAWRAWWAGQPDTA